MRGNAGTEEAKFGKGFSSVSFEMGAIGMFYQPRRENEHFKKSAASCCVYQPPAWCAGSAGGPGLGVRGAPRKYLRSEGASETEQQAGQPEAGSEEGAGKAGPGKDRGCWGSSTWGAGAGEAWPSGV